MFNFTLITIASIAAVGIMELVKLYLPETTPAKVKGAISLVLSAGIGVAAGYIMKVDIQTLLLSTGATVGMVQFSYDYVVKLLKKVIEYVQTRIDDNTAQLPLIEASVEKQLEAMLEGDCDCEDEECEKKK